MAEFIIELILEIIVEGTIELSSKKTVSKWIRYPLTAIIILVGLSLIGWLLWLSINIMFTSFVGGFVILIIALVLLIAMIRKIWSVYKTNFKEQKSTEGSRNNSLSL